VRTSSVVLLPCTPASVAVARRRLIEELLAAGFFGAVIGDAALVISELLSNAIRHARPLPGRRWK
jgi:anti-sigma regulatory factor (Ser/Thr protein kinase)